MQTSAPSMIFGNGRVQAAYNALTLVPGQITQGVAATTGSFRRVTTPTGVTDDQMVASLTVSLLAHAEARTGHALKIMAAVIALRWPALYDRTDAVLGYAWNDVPITLTQGVVAYLQTEVDVEHPDHAAMIAGTFPVTLDGVVCADAAAGTAHLATRGRQYVSTAIPELGIGALNPRIAGTRPVIDALLGVLIWATHQTYDATTAAMYGFRLAAAQRVAGVSSTDVNILTAAPVVAMYTGWTHTCECANSQRALVLHTVFKIARNELSDDFRCFWANASMLTGQGLQTMYNTSRLIVLHADIVRSIPDLEYEAALFCLQVQTFQGWSDYDKAFKKAIYGSALNLYQTRTVKNLTGVAAYYQTTLRARTSTTAHGFQVAGRIMDAFKAKLALKIANA